jgi:hypothetical protein
MCGNCHEVTFVSNCDVIVIVVRMQIEPNSKTKQKKKTAISHRQMAFNNFMNLKSSRNGGSRLIIEYNFQT